MTRIEKFSLLLLIPSASTLSTFISPELGLIKSYFSLTTEQLSFVMIYYLIGYLVGQGIWGYLSTKLGSSSCIRIGVFTAIIGALILLGAYHHHEYNSFILSRMLIGFGLSSGLVCGFTIIKETLPKEEQKKFITLVSLVFTAAIYTSIAFSGHLVNYGSLDIVIWMILGLCIIFFVFSLFISTPLHQESRPSKIGSFRIENYQITQIITYSLVLSITTIITYLYAFYAPLISSNLFSLSPKSYSSYSFINLFFILTGSFLFPYVNKKLPEYKICLYGLGIISLACLSITFFYSLSKSIFLLFFFCSYLMDFTLGIIYPAATVMTLEYGKNKAATAAVMNTIKLSLPIIAIYFSGRFFHNKVHSFSLTIFIFSTSFLVSLIIINAFFKPKTQPIIA